MVRSNILKPSSVRSVIAQQGCFSVIEYAKDISTTPQAALQAYFASQMNVRKR